MKTSCPACGQHLEYGGDLAGTTAPCPKCGADVSFPNLRVCPDCGEKVSRRAEVCPRCGAPVSASAPVSNAPAKVTEKVDFLILSALGAAGGLLSGIPFLFAPNARMAGVALIAAGFVACGVLFRHRWAISCEGCGYSGKPKVVGDAGCFIEALLLLFGVVPLLLFFGLSSFSPLVLLGALPWLFYEAFYHPRFYCPVCGREGFR